jgi:protoporphyrinogen oxidase
MSAPKKILIIGGGFTGLTAAYKLSREPDFSVTLVEGSDHLGGLAAGFPLGGTTLEKAYHHLFLTDTYILKLVEELDLTGKLMWCESSVGIYRDGRVYPLMEPADLLRFRPCSFLGRLRMGFTVLYLKHRTNWRHFAGKRACEWMRCACGCSAMETIWTPLLKGKFDRYYNSVSMAWLWARIHIRANSRGPGGSREKLGYFRGGFAEIIGKLESELSRHKVRILTGKAVEQLTFGPGRQALLTDGQAVGFDLCLFTGSSTAFARLLPAGVVPDDYRHKLESIAYLGAICLVFVTDQSIADQYWLNIHEAGAPFLLFIQHTRLVGTGMYQGRHVYYIGSYQPHDSALFGMSDDTLTGKWFDYLQRIYPQFDPARVCERHVFKFKAAQHVVDTRYEEKIPDYRTPVPGLFLANFSQIFPEDRGINFAVREGIKVAGMISRELSGKA